MYKKLLKTLVTAILITPCASKTVAAVPPLQEDWTLTMPDGSKQTVKLKYGEFFHIPNPQKLAEQTASLHQTFISDTARELTLGVGADFFWRCSVNGKVVKDLLLLGNNTSKYSSNNHKVVLPLKKGQNLIEFQVQGGSQGWGIIIGEYTRQSDLRPQDLYFHQFLPNDFFSQIAGTDHRYPLYPPYEDRKAWENVQKQANKQQLIKHIFEKGEKILASEIPLLTFSQYRSYAFNGIRTDENYYLRRDNLAVLVLCLALSGNEKKYLPTVMDYIMAMLEEWTWCIPPHAKFDKKTQSPFGHTQCDLAAAATGKIMGLTYNILGNLLEKNCAGFTQKMRQVTLKHTLYNIFDPKSGPYNWWFDREEPNNWTTYCAFCTMTTLLTMETDPVKREKYAHALLQGISRFLWNLPENGFYEEGPSYFGMAGEKVYMLAAMFNRLYPGSMKKLYSDPKIRAIFEFKANITISSKWRASFSDSGAFTSQMPCIGAFGYNENSDIIKLAVQDLVIDDTTFWRDYLVESLFLLFDFPAETEKIKITGSANTMFRDKLFVFRSENFAAALKAGHNAEYHNHNDLGHFSLWNREIPIVVDAGTGPYTRRNFSSQRYTLWYTRGNGHNAPVINGVEQQAGAVYAATLDYVTGKKNTVISDLNGIYPKETGVQKCIRTMTCLPEKIIVKDSVKTSSPGKINLHLLITALPEVNGDVLKISNTRLTLKNLRFVSCEPVEKCFPDPGPDWKEYKLYYLTLEASNGDYEMIFENLQ